MQEVSGRRPDRSPARRSASRAAEYPRALILGVEGLGALAIAAGLGLAVAPAVAQAEPTASSDATSGASSAASASRSGDSAASTKPASAVDSKPETKVRSSAGALLSDVTKRIASGTKVGARQAEATDPSDSVTTKRRASSLDRDDWTPRAHMSAFSVTPSTDGEDPPPRTEVDRQSTVTPRLSVAAPAESAPTPPAPDVPSSRSAPAPITSAQTSPATPPTRQRVAVVSTPLASVLGSPAAASPSAPAHPPLVEALLAWVRRKFPETELNTPPTVSYDSAHTIQVLDGTISGTLGVSDPDGDRVGLAVARQPENGTVVVAPDGTFTYIPNAGYAGPDTFTVRATDNTGLLVHGLLRLIVPGFHTGSTTVELTVAQVETIQVGDKPMGIALAPEAPRLYVTNNGADTVSVIDTTTNEVIGTIQVANGPTTVVLGMGGVIAYVGSQTGCSDCNGDTLAVIDVFNDANQVITTLEVPPVPQGLAVSPDGTRVYVASVAETLTVIDANSNEVTASIHIDTGLEDVAVSPDGSRVYVAGFVGNVGAVYVIDAATNEVITQIPVGTLASNLAVTPDGSHVYVPNAATAEDNTVSVIDTATNTVVATIEVGQGSAGVAVSPDGTRVYVANFTDNTVSVIDTATNKVITTIEVGTGPDQIAVSPDGTTVYVTNFNANTVSVITLN